MEDATKRLTELYQQVQDAWTHLKLDDILSEQKHLLDQMTKAGFWNDPETAQAISKQQAKVTKRIEPWMELRKGIKDMLELARTGDESLSEEITFQTTKFEMAFEVLKDELKFSGPYDDHNVLLSIHAGAGGTDAQDWAQMLLRMYTRWAEKHEFDAKIIDESAGDEAGIKSATLEIDGQLAFGRLKGEHGVHRLVRLSPFNADNLRQTSFAKVEVLPKIEQQSEVTVDDKDLKIDVYRAGGHGGQSVNTTDSAVRVTHIPTGITVAIQNERSQLQNKEVAMTILRSRLAQLQVEQHQEKISELKGPNQSAEWGNQIRSYVLHPYKQVKDLRSRYETSDVEGVLDGKLDELITAYLEHFLHTQA
jgi:peptide chain release factor 2